MTPVAKQTLTAASALTIAFAAGVAALVWPPHHRVARIQQRMESLRQKVESLEDREADVVRLTAQVEAVEAELDRDLRVIPGQPNSAALIRRLSMPVDNVTVRDQTFLTSGPVAAVPGGKLDTRAMQVTVQMRATFDSVFALIRSAETTDRLVRVPSVKLDAVRSEDDELLPFVTAEVELDAIFEPGELGEGW